MSLDPRFAGLLGDWPPSGPAPLLDPTQGQMNGLLPAQPAPQPSMGLLDVPGDPSSLFGPTSFDPMSLIAGGQGPAGASASLDPGGWLQALQALHASLRASSPPILPGAAGASASGEPAGVQPPPTLRESKAVIAAPILDAGAVQTVAPSLPVTHLTPAEPVPISVPSPHAADYPSNDAAARAMALDIPKDTPNEYATWFIKKEVPITFPDIGNGPVPFTLDRFSYPGLVTSNGPNDALLGAPPKGVIGWGHNHPYDITTNDENRVPSPADNDGKHGDWYWAKAIQKTTPDFETYILGPDGMLRRFHNSNDDEVDLR